MQLNVLRQISEYRREFAISPTLQQLGELIFASKQAAHDHVINLIDMGLLEEVRPGECRRRNFKLSQRGTRVVESAFPRGTLTNT